MKVDTQDIVGPAEVAEMAGVGVATVKRWRHREIFVEPLAVVSGTHLWRRQDVERWLRKTGRQSV